MKITNTPNAELKSTDGFRPTALPTATPTARLSLDGFQSANATPRPGASFASSFLPGGGFFAVSAGEVKQVRERNDPAEIAGVLHTLATDRSNLVIPNDDARLARMQELLGGMSAEQIDTVKAEYKAQYGCDPETNIRSWDVAQPLARLDDDVALKMVSLLNGPGLTKTASTLAGLLDKAKAGTLTAQDRATYFSMMPMIGLWNPPHRQAADGANLDSMERKILTGIWGEKEVGTGVSLDDAMKAIEAKLPPADLTPKAPREKSVAVIVSSAGAQWQELMDWATVMHDKGYQIQIFTPDGRPAAFQHDSLSVCERTAPLGHGCPPSLDPQGPTGELAKALLSNTAGAAQFNPKNFGAVFEAGGLGFNEDVAVATPVVGQDGREHTQLTANPNIAKMMSAAVAERLPNISICHGPTLLAATTMTINGHEEPVNKGIDTASLPPLEFYVGMTHRKEAQFTYDVNTQQVLAEAGGHTNTAADVLDMSRVVRANKDGMDIITGPAPQASRNLGFATLEAMEKRWGKAAN